MEFINGLVGGEDVASDRFQAGPNFASSSRTGYLNN